MVGLVTALLCSRCAPPLPVQLVGTYDSTTCETTGAANGYYYREAVFSTNNYSSTLRFFSDSACQAATLVYEQQGAYRLGQPSAAVPGATEVEFDAAVRALTAQTATAAAALNALFPCGGATAGGWVAGVRRDITMYGCKDLIPPSVGMPIPPSCPIEYDLLLLSGNTLQVGTRWSNSTQQCTATGRPSSLGAGLLRKSM
jgi:hypothetical protein